MNPLKGACIIGQSGGPTAVINASALGAIQSALQSEQVTRVLGAANGIEGVLKERLFDMAREDPGELELLKYTPASALGSCRYKMAAPSVDDTDYRRLLEIFRKYDVRYFFYNGGNDSMDTCNKISKFMQQSGYECRVIGIPKTIDNDLHGTDHCPGFGSAAKFIATSCMEVHQDLRVYDKGRVTIVEIMGRHAGWLAGSAALATYAGAGPDLVYLPEVPFRMEETGRMWTGFTGRTAAAWSPSRKACSMQTAALLRNPETGTSSAIRSWEAWEPCLRNPSSGKPGLKSEALNSHSSSAAPPMSLPRRISMKRIWREKPPWKPPFPARRIKW